MSDNKKEIIKSISLIELETDLQTKEQILNQVEIAHQQLIGQINYLKTLIKRAKGEDKKENNTEEVKK